MELYYVISITDRDRTDEMTALYQAQDLSLVLVQLGEGTATNEQLAVYGLEEAPKSVICAVADGESVRQLMRAAKRRLFIDIPGNGIMMTVPMKSVGGGRALAYLTGNKPVAGEAAPEMSFEYELIVTILNEGYSDIVMDAARSAGAGGGTILHARGTGGRESEKFMGVSIAVEKDILYIVARSEEKAAIMKAINKTTGAGTKAGAICFSLPVSSVIGLRKADDGR